MQVSLYKQIKVQYSISHCSGAWVHIIVGFPLHASVSFLYRFVEPPVLNMAQVVDDSNCSIPLIFVLSSGVVRTNIFALSQGLCAPGVYNIRVYY